MEDDAQNERAAVERDTDIEFFVAGGPGGQHRNKVATGVRLRHRPSGIVVTATERRSQTANREVAFARLLARLTNARITPPPRIATRPTFAGRLQRRLLKQQRAQLKQQRRRPSED